VGPATGAAKEVRRGDAGGYPGTTYFNLAHETATALAGWDDLRLITVGAPGGIESLRNLLLLRGVDLTLVPENVLDYAGAPASLGPRLRQRLTCITRSHGEEALVPPGADSIENLSSKKIAVPPESDNAEFTIRDSLRRLHIKAGNSTSTCELTSPQGRRRARPGYEDSCSKNF
jgi:hypothetical protein